MVVFPTSFCRQTDFFYRSSLEHMHSLRFGWYVLDLVSGRFVFCRYRMRLESFYSQVCGNRPSC